MVNNKSPVHLVGPTIGPNKIPIAELEFLKCPLCESSIFSKAGKLHPLNETGQDQVFFFDIMNTIRCSICGERISQGAPEGAGQKKGGAVMKLNIPDKEWVLFKSVLQEGRDYVKSRHFKEIKENLNDHITFNDIDALIWNPKLCPWIVKEGGVMAREQNWYWGMARDWAADSAEIKWERVYQAFKARSEAEENKFGQLCKDRRYCPAVDDSCEFYNKDKVCTHPGDKPPELECNHKIGYLPMFDENNEIVFVYKSEGINFYKPFKSCPDCGERLKDGLRQDR